MLTTLLLIHTLHVGSVESRECVVYPDIDDEFAAATAVFVGRVASVKELQGLRGAHVLTGSATIEIERSWKGQPPRRVELNLVGNRFEVGKRYVVFAFGPGLVADTCNRTKAVASSKETLDWLSRLPSQKAG